ncbi:MAG TPA: hypothetical protein VFU21_18255 [Kofleriaceae bacterium]|nr:hypothetical protein [Kofleriaceae bacterium]
MMLRTRFLTLAGLLTLGATAPGCLIVTDDDDASLEVINESDFVIEELYLTEVDNRDWGPDLLRGDVLFPDESIVLVDIECDYYDTQMIDETGAVCEAYNLDLCLNDAVWIIRNNTCTVWEAGGEVSVEKKPLPATGRTSEKQKNLAPAPAEQI